MGLQKNINGPNKVDKAIIGQVNLNATCSPKMKHHSSHAPLITHPRFGYLGVISDF